MQMERAFQVVNVMEKGSGSEGAKPAGEDSGVEGEEGEEEVPVVVEADGCTNALLGSQSGLLPPSPGSGGDSEDVTRAESWDAKGTLYKEFAKESKEKEKSSELLSPVGGGRLGRSEGRSNQKTGKRGAPSYPRHKPDGCNRGPAPGP